MKKLFYILLLLIGVTLFFAGAFTLGKGSLGTVVVMVIGGAVLAAVALKQLRKIRHKNTT